MKIVFLNRAKKTHGKNSKAEREWGWERVGRDRRRKEIYLFCFLYRSKSIYRYTHISKTNDSIYGQQQLISLHYLSRLCASLLALLACLFVYAMKRTSQSTHTNSKIVERFIINFCVLFELNWINWLKTWQLPLYRMMWNVCLARFVVRKIEQS